MGISEVDGFRIVTIECERTYCQYNDDSGKCASDHLEISVNGFCLTFYDEDEED